MRQHPNSWHSTGRSTAAWGFCAGVAQNHVEGRSGILKKASASPMLRIMERAQGPRIRARAIRSAAPRNHSQTSFLNSKVCP